MSGGAWLALALAVPPAAPCTQAPSRAAELAARAERERRWESFPVFVWFHGGPRPGPVPFATLAAAGLAACNVEADASSAAARAAGLGFYVDHLAGKGDLHLRPATFDPDRERLAADPLHFRPPRPSVLHDPALRARLLGRVEAGLERHAAAAPLAWVLDDELSLTRGVAPMDYCFAPPTLAALRTWLRAKYGGTEALSAAWGVAVPSFDAVLPPTTGEARAAARGRPLAALRFTAWNDHRAFMEESFADLLEELAAPVRRTDPGGPVGFTGGGFPSAFGGFDWARLAPGFTLHEPYEAGAAPDLVRSFAPRDARLLSTLFVPDRPEAGWRPLGLLARVARGDDGLVVWSSGPLLAPDGAALTAAGAEVARAVATARTLRAWLRSTEPAPPRLWIAASQPSARAGWMVDSWRDGDTWRNRLTSWESERSSTAAAREAWVALARSLGLPFAFFDLPGGLPAQVAQDAARQIVVLSETCAISDLRVAELARFVEAGGTLVADARFALFDDELRGRDGGALARLFGLARNVAQTLDGLAASVDPDAPRAAPLQLAPAESLLPLPAGGVVRRAGGFERRSGRGRALYLDAHLGGCVRGSQAEAALRATALALREALVRAPSGEAAPELGAEAIGRVELHALRRDGKAWWLLVPAPALAARFRGTFTLPDGLAGESFGIGGEGAEFWTRRGDGAGAPARGEFVISPGSAWAIAHD